MRLLMGDRYDKHKMVHHGPVYCIYSIKASMLDHYIAQVNASFLPVLIYENTRPKFPNIKQK